MEPGRLAPVDRASLRRRVSDSLGLSRHRRDRTLESLSRILRAAGGTFTLSELSSFVSCEVERLVHCDRAVFLVVDEDRCVTADGGVDEPFSEVPALQRLVESGLPTVSSLPSTGERTLMGRQVKAAVYVPVVVGGAVRGVIAVGRRKPESITPDDVRTLTQLGDSVSLGLTNALLHKRAEDAERDARVLVEAVAALSRPLRAVEVAEVACRHTRKIARARRVHLAVFDPEGDLTILGGNPSPQHPAVHADTGPLPDPVALVDHNQVVTCRTPQRFSVYVPVADDRETHAILRLDYPADHREPDDATLALCRAIAAQTAIALDRAERADELRRLATTDPLTGLANRRRLMGELRRELARAQRHDAPLSVAVIDLDRFKKYNDVHGHLAGDRLLREFSQSLLANLRVSDLAARLGGEEFLLVLPDSDEVGARLVVDRLRQIWRLTGTTTFSAGIAELGGTVDPAALIGRADVALYRAKKAGRDRICLASGNPDDDEPSQEALFGPDEMPTQQMLFPAEEAVLDLR